MYRLVLATAALAVLSSPSLANGTDTMKACEAGWKAMSPAAQSKTTYKDYSTACLKNHAAAGSMAHQQQMMGAQQHNMTPTQHAVAGTCAANCSH